METATPQNPSQIVLDILAIPLPVDARIPIKIEVVTSRWRDLVEDLKKNCSFAFFEGDKIKWNGFEITERHE